MISKGFDTKGFGLEKVFWEKTEDISGESCTALVCNKFKRERERDHGERWKVCACLDSDFPFLRCFSEAEGDALNRSFHSVSFKVNSKVMTANFRSQSVSDSIAVQEVQSNWNWINEPVGISNSNTFVKPGLLEQINTTADLSAYLWYSTSIEVQGNDGSKPVLHVNSLGHGLHAFINGKLAAPPTRTD